LGAAENLELENAGVSTQVDDSLDQVGDPVSRNAARTGAV